MSKLVNLLFFRDRERWHLKKTQSIFSMFLVLHNERTNHMLFFNDLLWLQLATFDVNLLLNYYYSVANYWNFSKLKLKFCWFIFYQLFFLFHFNCTFVQFQNYYFWVSLKQLIPLLLLLSLIFPFSSFHTVTKLHDNLRLLILEQSVTKSHTSPIK